MTKKKILSLCTAIAFCSVALFTGFKYAVQDSPFYKNTTMTSCSEDMTMNLGITAKDVPSDKLQQINQMLTVLNNSSITMHADANSSSDKQKVDEYIKLNAKSSIGAIDTAIWANVDATKSKPTIREIMQIPPIMQAMSSDLAGKQYLDMNFDNMPSDMSSAFKSLDMSQLLKAAESMSKALYNSADPFNPGINYLTTLGDKTITTPEGTVNAKAYEIKLDDAAFKTLLKYSVNYYANNKAFMDALKQYVNVMVPATDKTSKAKIDAAFADPQGVSKFVAQFNTAMDALKDVKLIGDKGIVIDYAVSPEGYIVSQSGSIDLVIDTAKLDAVDLSKVSSTTPAAITTGKSSGTYEFNIGFNATIYNINKPVNITYPTLTPANSVDYFKMMQSSMQSIKTAPAIKAPAKKAAAKKAAAKKAVVKKVIKAKKK